LIPVGDIKNPVGIIKRSEIEGYFSSEMWKIYNIWQKYELGFGLPFSGTWFDIPKHIIDLIEWCIIINKRIELHRRK